MTDPSECAAIALLDVLCDPGKPAREPPATMVIVAHPDDETVGAGSRLSRLVDARFVHVTDGAPLDGRDAVAHGLSVPEYAAVRQRELAKALALCGIDASHLLRLRCPDQRAALRLAALARALRRLFHEFRPAAVLTHLGAQGLQPGRFLPAGGGEVRTVHLTPEEQRHKRSLFDCFASQSRTLACFPLDVERFRRAPAYDFRAPPHPGPLFYESFPWGMTGTRFCGLAERAMSELGVRGPL